VVAILDSEVAILHRTGTNDFYTEQMALPKQTPSGSLHAQILSQEASEGEAMTPKRRRCVICGKLTEKWQRINFGPWHCYDGCRSTKEAKKKTKLMEEKQ
jgi:hypothetical protein